MGITDYERRLIGDLFRKANKLRGKASLRAPILKVGSRTPMHSQLGRILEEAGIGYVKPATIIKRVLLKGTPVTAENVRKVSSAPPMSSHHEGLVRPRGRIQVGRDSTNPKLATGDALVLLKWAVGLPRGLRE
jgi:hypothetical protein